MEQENKNEIVNEQNYQRIKKKVKKIAAFLIIFGIIFAAVGITLIVLANKNDESTPSAGLMIGSFFTIFIGIALVIFGVVTLITAHQREILAFHAGGMLPVAKDVVNYTSDNIAPAAGKGFETITKSVTSGIASGIKEVKNATKPTCPKCGEIVNVNDEFCSNCGAALKATKTCEKCGNVVDINKKFCPKCGNKF